MKDGTYVIKTWDMMEKEYGLTSERDINTNPVFLKKMGEAIPIHRHIKIVDDKWSGWQITDDMILSEAFKPGEMIEVRKDIGQKWYRKRFSGYSFDSYLPFSMLSREGYRINCKCARKIQALSIEITVKINGEESPLSDISEETLLKIRGGEG